MDEADPGRRSHSIRNPAPLRPGLPHVSVLTPTTLRPDRADFLVALYADLAAAAVEWEWVLAVDGEHDRPVPAAIAADPRVHVLRIGRSVGAAAARNLALGLAHGAYISSVDDDDHLPAGSLERRLAAAVESGAGWVAGRLADLRGGTVTVWDCPLRRGENAPGDVWRAWSCPCLPFPLGPTTLLVEATLLRSVGGWQGLPQAEDFGMVLAVTGRAAGVMLDDVVYRYRKHPGQMMAQPGFPDLEPLVRYITYERGRLLAGLPATGRSAA